jgi:glucose/mannose-6-phosphate isomerase
LSDLSPEAVERADPSGMLRTVLDLGAQCRTGYERGRAVRGLPDAAGLTAVVACGMGGSGVAGDVLRALYRDRLGLPFEVVKDAVLPEFCGKDTLVVCSSFSGRTAETLACFDVASERGCRLLVVSSGGELSKLAGDRGVPVVTVPTDDIPGPRAALGLLLFATLGALELMGLVPAVAEDLEESLSVLSSLASELGSERSDNAAIELARWIGDRSAVVWGAEGLGSVAATRWKTQLNENAKTPAFASSLPELDHNEIVGWTEGTGGRFVLLMLRHEGEHPQVALRFPASMEIASVSGIEGRDVWARGESSLSRLLSLVMMGDAVSVYLGVLRGFDPTPIENIERLKKVLEDAQE